jgi:pre-rRNA-processing protein IPI3
MIRVNFFLRQDQVALKIVMPERMSCIAIDPKGSYCAGGTSQGRIYFWEAGIYQLLK